MKSKQTIVGITSKGQATIPVEMRRRHKLEKRALIVDTDKGLLILPVPRPEDEKGSLKALFDKKAHELLSNARKVDNLLSFGLIPSEIKDDDLWREAGKLKATHNIPLADAFAAATANHLKATLVAGLT